MGSLYLRIYVTVVAVLALFALGSGWLVQRHLDEQNLRVESIQRERVEAWGDLLARSLPAADTPAAEQAVALRDWSQRLRLPMALDSALGERIAASESFLRRELQASGNLPRAQSVRLDDGRTLWLARPMGLRPPGSGRQGPGLAAQDMRPWWMLQRLMPDGIGLVVLLILIFLAVAGAAWPVVRRLTRRLEALKQGVEAFGAGALHQRVAEDGRDEVAALGISFNRAAARIETLLRSHQSLLANASHELRSPLARLKMAVAMVDDASEAGRAKLKREIDTNVAELDALVEEVLLASRLDASVETERRETLSLLAIAAEEAARTGAEVDGPDLPVLGDERLLRRAVRNLVENAHRYGGGEVQVQLAGVADGVELRVCDRGPGVPAAHRERVFEAFFRLPGHAEREGGAGLGLALVRQIAHRHGGHVRCEPRVGGGSCFVLQLPAA